jgi:CcmD family protein
MGYVFAAYAVFWGLTFILVIGMASKQKRLEKEIEALRRAVEKEKQ